MCPPPLLGGSRDAWVALLFGGEVPNGGPPCGGVACPHLALALLGAVRTCWSSQSKLGASRRAGRATAVDSPRWKGRTTSTGSLGPLRAALARAPYCGQGFFYASSPAPRSGTQSRSVRALSPTVRAPVWGRL
eukprot:13990255-Alexandrium_andersonii.AAC.1